MGFFDELGDILFGAEPEANIDSRSTLTPEQQEQLRSILGVLGPRASSPVEGFSGPLTSTPGAGFNTSLQALEDFALNFGGGGEDQLGADLQGASGGFNPTDFSQFFETNVRDPMVQDFSENVLPEIGRSFGGSNFFTSERRQADTQAREDLLTSLTRSRADLAFRTEEAAKNRALEALGLRVNRESNQSGNQLAALDALFGARAAERGFQERGIDRQFAEFTRRNDERSRRIQELLSALGLSAVENIATVTPGSTGLVQSFLSGASTGIGQGIGAKLI